ncbi:hypothetical protein PIB30_077737 [Stylosanthes scabra]|uniref:PB1-like domain-containing protein n=1 Tax=Stylosanthes scabra TaxID=79078 RepID=A0ABU6RQX5_9FABA|nr:hypothetical protein [Stylosanthes scabra]
MVHLTLVYHHGGSIVTKDNGSVVYEVDNIQELDQLDEDTLDVFAVKNHYLALNYEKIAKCSWLVLGSPLDTGLRPITIDVELLEMCRAVRENNNKIHIYYEHVISMPHVEEDVPELIEFTPNSVTVQESQSPMENTPPKSPPSQHSRPKGSKFKTVLPKSPPENQTKGKQSQSNHKTQQAKATPNPHAKAQSSSKPTPTPQTKA